MNVSSGQLRILNTAPLLVATDISLRPSSVRALGPGDFVIVIVIETVDSFVESMYEPDGIGVRKRVKIMTKLGIRWTSVATLETKTEVET